MKSIITIFQKKYPRNYLIENQYAGAVIVTLFTFIFMFLYKPLDVRASQNMSFTATMAVYSFAIGLSVILFIRILSLFRWFSDIKAWSLLREILSVFLILTGIGIVIYFMGFIVEAPADRVNFPTFFDSVSRAFLLGLIPFVFFSAVNYQHLLSSSGNESENMNFNPPNELEKEQKPMKVSSQLKKEELTFYPNQLLYAESDGNYVIFHIDSGGVIKKENIRNSMNNIEKELCTNRLFCRTHRAFIVNMEKIKSKQGNILGYQLKLHGTDCIIPVSRNNIRKFDQAFSGRQK